MIFALFGLRLYRYLKITRTCFCVHGKIKKCVRVTDVTEPTRIKAPGLKRLLPPSAPFPDSRTLPGPEDELHNLLSKIILN